MPHNILKITNQRLKPNLPKINKNTRQQNKLSRAPSKPEETILLSFCTPKRTKFRDQLKNQN